MGAAVPNRQYVCSLRAQESQRLFAFALNEVILKMQLRMLQL